MNRTFTERTVKRLNDLVDLVGNRIDSIQRLGGEPSDDTQRVSLDFEEAVALRDLANEAMKDQHEAVRHRVEAVLLGNGASPQSRMYLDVMKAMGQP